VKLTKHEIGEIIVQALRRLNGQQYLLFDYTILPDRVQFIIKPQPDPHGRPWPVPMLLQSVKAYSAPRINEVLDREGVFWRQSVGWAMLHWEREYKERAREIWELPKLSNLTRDPEKWPWWGNGKDEWE